ncbi:MAG: hypothetical protein AAGF98_19520 [Cyanobacteria bacterium P01_H01_bin.153]
MFALRFFAARRGNLGRRSLHWLGGALLLGVVTGCVVTEEPDATSPEPPPEVEEIGLPEMVPEVVSDRVLELAANQLLVPIEELSFLRVNQAVWQDSCLGLGRLNESCLQALVPGWQVEVVHNDRSLFYRTDETGELIRLSTLDNNLPPAIAATIIEMAASDLGIPADQLAVISAEPRVWDGCLGIAEPDTFCTQIAIFGWRALVEGNGETWIYHTDMTGADIRLNDLE